MAWKGRDRPWVYSGVEKKGFKGGRGVMEKSVR